MNIDISSKKRLCSTVDLFSVVRVILFNIHKKIQTFFFIFQGEVGGEGGGGEEGLKFQNHNILNFCVRGIFRTYQTSEMELFAVKSFQKILILDIWILNKTLIVIRTFH